MNNKHIQTAFNIFENPAIYKEIMTNTCDKMQEYLDEDDEGLTVEGIVEQFKYELDGMISEYLLVASLGIDLETYYESHNGQITVDILQSMIDEENENE